MSILRLALSLAPLVALMSLIQPADAGQDRSSAQKLFQYLTGQPVQLGPRPFYLIEEMEDSQLKTALQQCERGPFFQTTFSIGHRGAALQFPEHTAESYRAAARMGAGIIECDVTFTKDRQLVCRHSQCDLHTTTNILAIPELAAKCSQPFQPANPLTGEPASASCCTSDITLEEFRQLCGKMDGANTAATTVAEYLQGTASWRTDLYSHCGTLMTHQESIHLIDALGADFTPELKSPSVEMPFDGDYTQAAYAQQMIDEYREADINPKRVWPQSFNKEDVLYWLEHNPEFGRQGVYLDGRYDEPEFELATVSTPAAMQALVADGIKVLAPPLWMLITTNSRGDIVASDYARNAKAAGLNLIAWTLERSGPLQSGGGWYHQTVTDAIDNDGDTFEVLDVLARDVGVMGVFSDWPATTTYYANCLQLHKFKSKLDSRFH